MFHNVWLYLRRENAWLEEGNDLAVAVDKELGEIVRDICTLQF